MSDDRTDRRMERILDTVREAFNAPGETPREAMWEVIERGLEVNAGGEVIDLAAARTRVSRSLRWAVAAAAVLVVGVGIGRVTSPAPNSAAVASAPPESVPRLQFAAAEHFGRTESLLTMVRADARRGQIDPMTGTWARGLLAQTRLLIDARDGGEPAMDVLLEDLELVLAQIVGLSEGGSMDGGRARTELELALRGLEDRELLGRLQAAGPPVGLSGT